MSQATLASMKTGGMVVLTVLLFFVFAGGPAAADPCADSCRSQHNACRMAAKLLFSGRCDALLQGCIMRCFADARANRSRDFREGRDLREFRDRRGPPDLRGPPAMRVPPEFRGEPQFRDQPELRGPGLNGPGLSGPGLRGPGLRDPEFRAPPLREPELRGPAPRGLDPRGPEPRDLEPRGPGLRDPGLRDPELRGQGPIAPEGRRPARDFRDGVPPAGQRWLGGPGGWRGGY